MRQNLTWKSVLVLALTALCIFFYYFDSKKGFNSKGNLKLGLDLKGGVHLVLLMNTDVTVVNKTTLDAGAIQEELKKANIPSDTPVVDEEKAPSVIRVNGKDPNLGVKLREFCDKKFPYYTFEAVGPGQFALSMKSSFESELREGAVVQSIETISNRINKYGVSETAIHRQGGIGSNKVVVELPGVEDATEVKSLIGKAAVLGWHQTLEPTSGLPTKDGFLQQYGGTIPPDVKIFQGSPDKYGGAQIYFAVKSIPVVSGSDLVQVQVEGNQFGQPVVGFQLSAVAGQKFREFTRAHVGDFAAIVLDNMVISNPRINSEIGDKGIIEGNFTPQESKELVLQLKSGALPAIPVFAEERTVGPSLGLYSIRRGTQSGLIGLTAIFLCLLAYYWASGVNAIVTLVLNFVMLMGIMSTFGMTLTVPGIAGIILTLGMAVDANVLIFERIKDEINEKKSVATAVTNGFAKAFSAILDGNVTTIVSALILLWFGFGPVRGYAVTLTVGLLISMFTAVFVSHLIYDWVLAVRGRNGEVKTLSIGSLTSFRGFKFPFMRYKMPFLLLSLLLCTGSVISLATRGLNWGIEFRGGQELQIKYASAVDARAIEAQLRKAVPTSLTVVRYGQPEDNEILIRLEAKDAQGNVLSDEALAASLKTIYDTLHDDASKTLVASGKLDLNLITARSLEDAILEGVNTGAIVGTAEGAAESARAVLGFKRDHGGIISSLDALKGTAGVSDNMLTYLKGKAGVGNFSILRTESVGPTISTEQRWKTLWTVLLSLVAILIYAWFRFHLRFGVGAVLALVHDALIALGALSFFRVVVDMPAVAAVLTLVGYSINDTIVIFDRVREHMALEKKREDADLMDRAMNETLSRTIITSMLTFFVVLAMLVWGGEAIFSFSFVMTIGLVVGSYSTIFMASPVVLWWNRLGVESWFTSKKDTKRR